MRHEPRVTIDTDAGRGEERRCAAEVGVDRRIVGVARVKVDGEVDRHRRRDVERSGSGLGKGGIGAAANSPGHSPARHRLPDEADGQPVRVIVDDLGGGQALAAVAAIWQVADCESLASGGKSGATGTAP